MTGKIRYHAGLPYVVWLQPSLKHWNGYVGVPKDHPYFGKGYDASLCGHDGCYLDTPDRRIGAHGGLTYAGNGKHFDGPAEFWWFGFDTAHSFDDPRYGGFVKDEKFVEAECRKIAEQLSNRERLGANTRCKS